MQEKLIEFETAKLAKEKEFDWETFGFYFKNFNPGLDYVLVDYIGDGQFGVINKRINHNEFNSPIERISVPSQSLLQKWLKEVCNIDVQPICNYHNQLGRRYHLGIIFINDKNKIDTIIIKETDKSLDTVNRYYNSYEEALEEGLFQSLKLIK